jgi:hypothetical protein
MDDNTKYNLSSWQSFRAPSLSSVEDEHRQSASDRTKTFFENDELRQSPPPSLSLSSSSSSSSSSGETTNHLGGLDERRRRRRRRRLIGGATAASGVAGLIVVGPMIAVVAAGTAAAIGMSSTKKNKSISGKVATAAHNDDRDDDSAASRPSSVVGLLGVATNAQSIEIADEKQNSRIDTAPSRIGWRTKSTWIPNRLVANSRTLPTATAQDNEHTLYIPKTTPITQASPWTPI